jgi:hypothetical protein
MTKLERKKKDAARRKKINLLYKLIVVTVDEIQYVEYTIYQIIHLWIFWHQLKITI